MSVRLHVVAIAAALLAVVPASASANVTLGSGASTGPAVAAGATGFVVAWQRTDGTTAARHGDAEITVSGSGDAGNGQQPAAAATTDGGVLIAWVRTGDAHLLVRRVGADGTLGTTWDASGESLSLVNGRAAIAANAAGQAVVAWRRGSTSHVVVRRLDANGQPVAAYVDQSDEPDIALWGTNVSVAIDAAGAAAIAWHRNTDCHIIVRRVQPDGSRGALLDVSGEPDSAIGDTNPGVAMTAGGDVVAAWHRDADHHAVSRRWPVQGDLGPLTDHAEIPSMADLAVAMAGDDLLLALQRESDTHVLARGGDLSAGATLKGAPPSVAIAPDGATAVAWTTAAGDVMTAATDSTPAPALTVTQTVAEPAGTTPAAGRLTVARRAHRRGRRTKLTLRCRGAGPCAATIELRTRTGRRLGRRAIEVAAGADATTRFRTGRRNRFTVVIRDAAGTRRTRITAR